MSDVHWRVRLARSAEKDLDRLDPQVRTRVLRAIRRFAENPRTGKALKLRGRPDWRLRVGDWRVLLELEQGARTIRVKRVLPRGRAYR